VADNLAKAVAAAGDLNIFKLAVNCVHVNSDHGIKILSSIEKILQSARTLHSLDICNIYCQFDDDARFLGVLSLAKDVECLSFRNIKLLNPFATPYRSPSQNGPASLVDATQIVTYMDASCMPVMWIDTVKGASKLSCIKSLTISQNSLLTEDYMKCAEMLWR
jgi:hypothetical protein